MVDLVHADSDLENILKMHECLGSKEIIIVKEITTIQNFTKWKEEFSKIKSELNLIFGVELNPKNVKDLENLVNHIRKDAKIIAVRGGNYEINRASCENEKVDIIIDPEEDRTDRGMDEYTSNEAIKNGVIIAISFRKILENYKKSRAFKLSFIEQNSRLLKGNIVMISDAYSKWEVRSRRNLDDFLSSVVNKKIDSSKILNNKIKNNNKKSTQVHEGVRLVK